MLVAGLIEFGLARQQVIDQALEESRRDYELLAAGLEDALAEKTGRAERSEAMAHQLAHVKRSNGTVYVGLFDGDGKLLASSDSGADGGASEEEDAGRLSEVLLTGRTTVKTESEIGGTGVTRYEFLVPVSSPDGLLVLEVDQEAGVIAGLLRDIGPNKLFGLLTAVLVATPLSYVLGGRSLQRRHLRAQQEADADPLTGLSGRRPFQPSLEARLADRKYSVVALALLDLDGFKQQNDRLGHSHGDRVLMGLADAFDELAADDVPFRLGGDEFAVILPGSDEDQATEALERVRAALAPRFPGATFSAGIAVSHAAEPVGLQELWERSDAALYEAKRLGRRRTVTFASMAEGHIVSAEKIDELTHLVSGDTPLRIAFQPIWDLHRGVVLAHEALMRLPEGSRINGPQEAFDLAERLGIAAALDARARSAVLASVGSRQWEGLLFLNVHPDALHSFDLGGLVSDLAVAGLEPEDVVLEVTEQAALHHAEPVRTLRQAQDLGFRLALDDMGRSNAGLHALRLVRFDIIKIDGEVVARLGVDPSSMATVSAAITFIQEAGGWIVAEGIETPGMLSALLQPRFSAMLQPVVAGQGYLLGRPDGQPLALDARIGVLDRYLRDPAEDPDGLDEAFYRNS